MFFIPTDRIGYDNYQQSIGQTYRTINQLLAAGVYVKWHTREQRLITSRWPEGHIYDSGFEVENCEKAREILDEAGLVREEVQELSGAGRMLRSMKIAFYMGRGAGVDFAKPLEEVLGWGGFFMDSLKDEDIRAGKLENYDALVVPGSPDAGECYYHGLGELGFEKIREFIRDRGHYLGVCGGAYLPLTSYNTQNHTWLNIVEATDTEDLDYWRTGSAHVRCRIDMSDHPVFAGVTAGNRNSVNIVYWEDPAIEIRGDNVKRLGHFERLLVSGAELAPYWDMFDNELAKEATDGYYNPVTQEVFDELLYQKTAFAEAEYGGHHILMYSPHPEMGNVGYAKRKDTINFLLLYNGLFYLSSL